MPTGTGKTETMLAILVCAQLRRVLVIVPTSALRDQLTEKFLTLDMLQGPRLAPNTIRSEDFFLVKSLIWAR
jgi:superfamily II DNA or RNA helicase